MVLIIFEPLSHQGRVLGNAEQLMRLAIDLHPIMVNVSAENRYLKHITDTPKGG